MKETPGMPFSDAIRITGMGALTPFGVGVSAYWDSIAKGIHAFSEIEVFKATAHRTHVAAEIKTLPALNARRLADRTSIVIPC